MFLVDNFKIILLVGLIYTAGIIPSSSAFKCNKEAVDCAAPNLCVIDKDGAATGCKPAPTGAAACTATQTALFCDPAWGCCCAADACDDLSKDSTYKEQCKIEKLKKPLAGNCTATGPAPAPGVKAAFTCVKDGQPKECDDPNKVCKILNNGTQEGCVAADDKCKAGQLTCGDDHCCCNDMADCNVVKPNNALCTKFPNVTGCSTTGSSSTTPAATSTLLVCRTDSTPCAPGQVCKIDAEGEPVGCSNATETCKVGKFKCVADMCCCSDPVSKCDSEEMFKTRQICPHVKLKKKFPKVHCSTDPGTHNEWSGSAGLFQHYYGGLTILAFVSASMYFAALKSLL